MKFNNPNIDPGNFFNSIIINSLEKIIIEEIIYQPLEISNNNINRLDDIFPNFEAADLLTKIDSGEIPFAFIVGLDIKIDPKGNLFIIELNGNNSGIKGFGVSNPEHDPNSSTTRNKIESALLQITGKAIHHDDIADIPQLIKRGRISQLGNKIIDKFKPLFEYQGNKFSMLELLLDSKKKMDSWFDIVGRKFKAKSYQFRKVNLDELSLQGVQKVVVKPDNESQGRGVKVYNIKDAYENIDPDLILERYIESKPILNPNTNEEHEGCMRYLVVISQDKKGKVKLHHIGGYWRLDRLPIGKGDGVINLAKDALALKATDHELDFVRNTLESFLPELFERILNS